MRIAELFWTGIALGLIILHDGQAVTLLKNGLVYSEDQLDMWSSNALKGEQMTIEQVMRANEVKLMALKGVEGVGIGADEIGNPAILIYTSDPSIESQLPKRIGDYPVLIESLGGPIRAYPKR